MIIFHFVKNSFILFLDHIKITKTIFHFRKESFLKLNIVKYCQQTYAFFKEVFMFVLSDFKTIYFFFRKYIPLIILFVFKKLFVSKKSFKATAKKKTPNLTLYYPLQSSILSVSIRFMGTILLIILLFCMSFFFLIIIFDLDFKIVILLLNLLLYVVLATFCFHSINSLTHFLKN
jgi:hypothetical protein